MYYIYTTGSSHWFIQLCDDVSWLSPVVCASLTSQVPHFAIIMEKSQENRQKMMLESPKIMIQKHSEVAAII